MPNIQFEVPYLLCRSVAAAINATPISSPRFPGTVSESAESYDGGDTGLLIVKFPNPPGIPELIARWHTAPTAENLAALWHALDVLANRIFTPESGGRYKAGEIGCQKQIEVW